MKHNGNFSGYIKVECIRIFTNWKFYAGILAVILVFILGASIQEKNVHTSLEAIEEGIYGMTGLIALMTCSLSYAGSFCEDLENGYLTAQCLRGNIKTFVKCRVSMMFLASMFTMIFGITGYAIYIKIQYGIWLNSESAAYSVVKEMGTWYASLLKTAPIFYFMLIGCLYGMLAGLLSLLSGLFSLFSANKLLTASIPFLAMYLFLNLSAVGSLWEGKLNVWIIYQPFWGAMKTDVLCFLYALGFACISGFFLYRLILWRVEWRLFHE